MWIRLIKVRWVCKYVLLHATVTSPPSYAVLRWLPPWKISPHRGASEDSLNFYSLLTLDWLYAWQLFLPLRHSPHSLLQHPSHQERQNKGRPTCYYYWMTGINHTIPSCRRSRLRREGRKSEMGKLTNTCISGLLLPPTSSVCVLIDTHTHPLQMYLIINPHCLRFQQCVTSQSFKKLMIGQFATI